MKEMPPISGLAERKAGEKLEDGFSWDPRFPHNDPFIFGTMISISDVTRLLRLDKSWGEIIKIFPQINENDIRDCIQYESRQLR